MSLQQELIPNPDAGKYMVFDPKVLRNTARRVSRLTSQNSHGESYIAISKLLGLDELVAKFEQILRKHIEIGNLPMDLYQERYTAYEEMEGFARSHMSPQDFQKLFNSC